MKRFLVSIVLLIFLVGCGGGTTSTPVQPQPSANAAIVGKYNGNFQLDDKVSDTFINGLTTFTIAADGTTTGTVNTKSPSKFEETGTFTGTITVTGTVSGSLELIAVFPQAGTYTFKGNVTHSQGSLAGSLVTAKNDNDEFVGNLSLVGTRE